MKIDAAEVGKVALAALQLFLKILSGVGKKSAFASINSVAEKILGMKVITPKAIRDLATAFAKAGGQTTANGKQPGALDAAADALLQFKALKESGHDADFHLDQAAAAIRAMAVDAAKVASEIYTVADKWEK